MTRFLRSILIGSLVVIVVQLVGPGVLRALRIEQAEGFGTDDIITALLGGLALALITQFIR